MKITLVTGNKGKLVEWQRLVPAQLVLTSADIDLDEIQTLDMQELLADKASRAYAVVGSPVIVEDVWAGLEALNGLPGPFIKYFEKKLGKDALFQLAKSSGDAATVRCGAAYFDGNKLVFVEAVVTGSVREAQGQNGFGFDSCFVPSGETKTYAQMSPEEKDAVSHRSKVVALLTEKLADRL